MNSGDGWSSRFEFTDGVAGATAVPSPGGVAISR